MSHTQSVSVPLKTLAENEIWTLVFFLFGRKVLPDALYGYKVSSVFFGVLSVL